MGVLLISLLAAKEEALLINCVSILEDNSNIAEQ